MPLYSFDQKQEFISIDKIPDFRSDEEKLNSPLSTYNHQSPDLAYAERIVEEMINLSGAWVTVYLRAINSGNKDETWDEDADPKFFKGIKIKGYFAPKPVESVLTKWGVDTPNQTKIWFSRANVYKLFSNRMISAGDLIVVPHNTMSIVQIDARDGVGTRMDRFRVINAADDGNFKYRWLYWQATCENLTGDPSIDAPFIPEKSS